MKKTSPEVVREILRLRDVEGMSVEEIADEIKKKFGVELKPAQVWSYYNVAKSMISCSEEDLELMRRVLKLYKEGKSPVDAVIEVDGVTLEFAERAYIWFMGQEKHHAEGLKITKKLIEKILNTEIEDGVSLREIFEEYDRMLDTMKKLVKEVEELKRDVEDAISTVQNLSTTLTAEIEKLDRVVYDAGEVLERFKEVPERLNERSDKMERLLGEILENQRKGFFGRLTGK